MSGDRKIQQAVQMLSGTHLSDKVFFIDAKVLSVNKQARTCRVQAIGGKTANVFTARLMAVVDDGILIIPAVDSTVSVVRSDFTKPMVAQYGEVDEIIIRGGDLGGLIKVADLTAKLNTFVQQIQAELVKVQTGITAVGGTYVLGRLSDFSKDDYENKKVTHG